MVKPSDVLRRAAKRIETSKCVGCCPAILNQKGVSNKAKDRAYKLFSSLYRPKKADKTWWFHRGDWSWEATPKSQEHRVMALLLTADMAESVGE